MWFINKFRSFREKKLEIDIWDMDNFCVYVVLYVMMGN